MTRSFYAPQYRTKWYGARYSGTLFMFVNTQEEQIQGVQRAAVYFENALHKTSRMHVKER